MKVKRLKVLAAFLRLTITALVLTCLFSTLVPVSAIASVLGIGAMKCCRTSSAGHCHASGEDQETCYQGRSDVRAQDSKPRKAQLITTMWRSTDNEGLHFASISEQCGFDCGSCAVRSTEQQKRVVALTITGHTSHLRKLRARNFPHFISKARFEIEPFPARGPPADPRTT